jgi:hypothetical protein
MALELDCLGPVAKQVSKEVDWSVHGPLAEDIKSRLKGFGNFAVNHECDIQAMQ